MIWITALLAVFLFYKFVERKHKIQLCKILAVMIIAAIGLTGGIYLYAELSKYIERSWLEVKYINHVVHTKASWKEPIIKMMQAEQAIIGPIEAVFPYYSHEELNSFCEELIYVHLGSPQLEDMTEAELVLMDAALRSPNVTDKDKKMVLEEGTKSVESIPLFRKQYGENSLAFINKLAALQRLYVNVPEIKLGITSALTQKEKELLSSYQSLLNELAEPLHNLINSSKELASSITFEICNSRDISLKSYDFRVTGYKKDRSSKHALQGDSYLSSTSFESDLIIDPSSCRTVVWKDNYKFFHRYEVTEVRGKWD